MRNAHISEHKCVGKDSRGVLQSDYETIIIVTPLWWSQMAAPMQTYLFNYGGQMAGKNVGLIVSSASSGISGVVADCKRLVPDGKYFSENLWINHSRHSNRASLIQNWLTAINNNTVTGISEVKTTTSAPISIYDLAGRLLKQKPSKPDLRGVLRRIAC